jgi:hypothetical protein
MYLVREVMFRSEPQEPFDDDRFTQLQIFSRRGMHDHPIPATSAIGPHNPAWLGARRRDSRRCAPDTPFSRANRFQPHDAGYGNR